MYNLTKNMRLLKNTLPPDEANHAKEFSEWILKVGDGKLAEPNDGEAFIDIPEDFLITNKDDLIQSISREAYVDPRLLLKQPSFFLINNVKQFHCGNNHKQNNPNNQFNKPINKI